MPRKKVPPCALVAGDTPDSPRFGTIVVIALVFGFEAYLLGVGVNAVTTVVLAAAGVLIAGTAVAKPADVTRVLKQLAAFLRLFGLVTP